MITRNKLKELYALTDKVNEAKEFASELVKTAQDRFNNKKHKLLRDGKEIEITEKILWDEVYYIGPASQAGQILTKEHPEVFEAFKKQEEIADELKKYCITELGVDYTAMTLSGYIKLTEQMLTMLLDEKGIKAIPWYKKIINIFK